MRAAIEKILIIVPASLRIQWQDDLLRFFNEHLLSSTLNLIDSKSLTSGRRKIK